MHNGAMRRERSNPFGTGLTALVRSVRDRVKRWRGQPPQQSGVREPRRPRPTLPAAAVALKEPRVALYRRWTKLTWRQGTDRP